MKMLLAKYLVVILAIGSAHLSSADPVGAVEGSSNPSAHLYLRHQEDTADTVGHALVGNATSSAIDGLPLEEEDATLGHTAGTAAGSTLPNDGGGATMLRGRKLSTGFIWKPYVILGDHQNLKILWRSASSCLSCTITTSCGSPIPITVGLLPNSFAGEHCMYEVDICPTGGACCSGASLNYEVSCDTGGVAYESGTVLLPPASSTERTKFIAYGDTRNGVPAHNDVAASMGADYRGLVLHVGDYVYDGSKIEEWSDMLFATGQAYIEGLLRSSPINGCRGNHENGKSTSMGAASDYSTLYDNVLPYDWATQYHYPAPNVPDSSDPYCNDNCDCDAPLPPDPENPDHRRHLSYSFDYGAFHISVVDQYGPKPKGKHGESYSNGAVYDDEYATCGTEYFKWLDCDLKKANDTNHPFKLVVLHEPLYSAGGGHGNEIEPDLDALLQKHKVDLVAGHNHYYARANVPNTRASRTTGGGTVKRCIIHVTTGGGGTGLYAPCTAGPDCASRGFPYIMRTLQAHHHTRFDASAPDDYFCFEAVATDGTIFDCVEHGDRPSGWRYCGGCIDCCDKVDDCDGGCTGEDCNPDPVCEADDSGPGPGPTCVEWNGQCTIDGNGNDNCCASMSCETIGKQERCRS